jgi:hypothetical protein
MSVFEAVKTPGIAARQVIQAPEVVKAPIDLAMQIATTGYAVAGWRDLFMAAFRPRPQEYDYSELDRWLSAFAHEQPGPFGYFAIVETGVGVGRRASKKRLEDALFKHADRFRFAAIVIEDEGFKGAALRGVLSMLGILSGKRHPESFLPRVEVSVRWMHGIYSRTEGPKPTQEELASAILNFRSEYQRRTSA